MTYVGLSILIASITFVCYKIPPSSWSFIQWLRGQGRALPRVKDAPKSTVEAEVAEPDIVCGSMTADEDDSTSDRKAMPPPLFRKIPPQAALLPILEAAVVTKPPDFPVLVVDDLPESPPSFPARNSAQRASGGRGPPGPNSIPTVQPPLRSLGLMSPPMRSPPINRSSASISSSLALPPTYSTIPTKARNKVELKPGHSPLDWAKLMNSPDANLRGLPVTTPYLRVPPSLLRQYTGRKGKDAWTVLGGKVYNITPYLPYHPGGEPELLKSAGRDGTKLFGEVHPWVNWENMLEPCLVGVAVGEEQIKAQGKLDEMD